MPEEYYSLTEEQPRIDDVKRQKKLKLTDQVFLRCVCKNNDAEKKFFFFHRCIFNYLFLTVLIYYYLFFYGTRYTIWRSISSKFSFFPS